MPIIKLDAIDSTNNFLREISSADVLDDYTIVLAEHQTQAKGQMGTVWSSQRAKNLTFSVFKRIDKWAPEQQFYVSMLVALSLIKTLDFFHIPKLSIKWPNDILSAHKKLSGILIENVIQKKAWRQAIIGVGLNVNQSQFQNLPQATSMSLIMGRTYDRDEVLHVFQEQLKAYFSLLDAGKTETIKAEYEALLFRKNKPSTFKNAEGLQFSGFIQGVSTSGNLIVLLEDAILKEFSLKEIRLLY